MMMGPLLWLVAADGARATKRIAKRLKYPTTSFYFIYAFFFSSSFNCLLAQFYIKHLFMIKNLYFQYGFMIIFSILSLVF